MDELRAARGNKCEDCGNEVKHWDKMVGIKLEFAHIKPTGLNGKSRGRANRYHDIKKHPECYKLLCKRCHKKFDNN